MPTRKTTRATPRRPRAPAREKTLRDDPTIPRHFFTRVAEGRDLPVKTKHCDSPGCTQTGEFRAPRTRAADADPSTPRSKKDFYWFCLDHVREYNAQWNYYQGLNTEEMEEAVRFSGTWERPTWPFARGMERKVRHAFRRAFFDEGPAEEEAESQARARARMDPRYARELEALAEMDLVPPVDFVAIKARYRVLVKQHHPDAASAEGRDPAQAEEKIKRLNEAFTVLKTFYAVEN